MRQHRFHCGFDAVGGGVLVKGVAQHHRHRQDGGQRIGQALAGDVRGGAMNRFVQALAVGVQRGGRQHADRAGEHRGFIGQDVAKNIAGDHHIELFRVFYQLHGGVVHQHVRQLNVRVLGGHFGDHVAPQLGGFQHVHFVHRAQLFAALLRGLERHVSDAADFAFAVNHGVEADSFAVAHFNAARLAKVDVAHQFADDHDVQAGHHFRLQRRGVGQLGVEDRRAQVGEHVHLFANFQQTALRTLFARQHIVLGAAHRAQQHGVGFQRQLQRGVRQRHASGVHRATANQAGFGFNRQAFGLEHVEHAQRLRNNFRTNAVTRQNSNFHLSFPCQTMF